MKKLNFLVAILLCSFIVQAQNTSKFRFGFELRPGFSYLSSNLTNENSLDGGYAISFGLPITYVMSEFNSLIYGVYIKNNVGYMRFKGLYPDNDKSIFVEQDIKATSLEIPILLSMNFDEIGYLQMGFALNYILKASAQERIEFRNDNLKPIHISNVDVKDKFYRFGLTYEVAFVKEFTIIKNLNTYGLLNLSYMITNCLKDFNDYQGSNGYPIDEDGSFYNLTLGIGVWF